MSANPEPLDVLLKLQRLRVKFARNMPFDREAMISAVAHAIDEVERLRLSNERLRSERELIERTIMGRPRFGGLAR